MSQNNPTAPSGEANIHNQAARLKSDPAWAHVSEAISQDNKKALICNFCQKTYRGGGIHRLKMHLAGRKGDIGPCLKVPSDVRYRMQQSLDEVGEQKRQRQANYEESHSLERNPHESQVIDADGGTSCNQPSNTHVTSSRKRKGALDSYFPSGTTPGSQPTIKSVLQSKEKLHEVDFAIARFFYDACIPFNAANSFYFQPMVDAIASVGMGYKAPTYHAIRVNLLSDAKAEVKLLIDTYRSTWAETGCTVMGDGWKDCRDRSLINFLVYCPRGTAFLKSVDASDFITDGSTLCNLFAEIVEMVGPQNVVHLVTDNASNYKCAGRLLNDKYPNISWSPCAAHCINLMLKDIASLPHVDNLKKLAGMITVFVYNHKWTLAFLRKGQGWREILRPGDTRFATTFIALNSVYDHKQTLQAMVTSKEFDQWNVSKTSKATEVKQIILDSAFWNNCLLIVKIVGPLIRLLRLVDSDEKPSLGYVYEGMYRARKAVKEIFQGKKRLYKQYTKIMKDRWDKQLRKDIHAAAYWLNPAFQYNQANFCQKAEVMNGLLEVIDTKAIGVSTRKMMEETTLFRERRNTFGRKMALDCSASMRPDEWWHMFGHDTPNLKKLAIRLLSQTSASSGCERNWSAFERIHTKKRNRLEHERLNDLVYVHYNLHLRNRLHNRKREYDPIDYECIDKIEFWVVEEDPSPEIEIDELEEAISHEKNQVGGSSSNTFNEMDGDEDGLDLSGFVGIVEGNESGDNEDDC